MSPSSAYDRVYRLNSPAGWKGRRCRIVVGSPMRRDWLGRGEINTGETIVAIEFDDGERASVSRQAVVLLASRLGRQAAHVAAVGGTREERNAMLQQKWRERRRAS